MKLMAAAYLNAQIYRLSQVLEKDELQLTNYTNSQIITCLHVTLVLAQTAVISYYYYLALKTESDEKYFDTRNKVFTAAEVIMSLLDIILCAQICFIVYES